MQDARTGCVQRFSIAVGQHSAQNDATFPWCLSRQYSRVSPYDHIIHSERLISSRPAKRAKGVTNHDRSVPGSLQHLWNASAVGLSSKKPIPSIYASPPAPHPLRHPNYMVTGRTERSMWVQGVVLATRDPTVLSAARNSASSMALQHGGQYVWAQSSVRPHLNHSGLVNILRVVPMSSSVF